MKKEDNLSSKSVLKIVLGVSLVGFLLCIGIVTAYFLTTKKANENYTKIQEEYSTTEAENQSEQAQNEQEEYVCPVDFTALQNHECADIYAWIKIPDTKIDYPIVQHPEDNTYYLTHTIAGDYGYPGSIYTELYNQKDFKDTMTVIYGHNMKDGSMFRDLYKFMDKDFFDTHEDFSIYLPDCEIKYKVFAAYETTDQSILVWNDFTDKEMFQFELEIRQEKEETETDHVRRDLEVTTDDRYVVLETCLDDQPKRRYVVLAKEIQ